MNNKKTIAHFYSYLQSRLNFLDIKINYTSEQNVFQNFS